MNIKHLLAYMACFGLGILAVRAYVPELANNHQSLEEIHDFERYNLLLGSGLAFCLFGPLVHLMEWMHTKRETQASRKALALTCVPLGTAGIDFVLSRLWWFLNQFVDVPYSFADNVLIAIFMPLSWFTPVVEFVAVIWGCGLAWKEFIGGERLKITGHVAALFMVVVALAAKWWLIETPRDY